MKRTKIQISLAQGSIILLLIFVVVSGCKSTKSVIAVTGTNLGIDISQDPATNTPQFKLGYNRAEVAVVSKEKYGDDVANVLMELQYRGGTNNQGIYQRLAVGRTAVEQGGAAAMFMKGPDGTIDPEQIKAAKEALDSFDAGKTFDK